jgi:hypothetical protein
MLGEVKSRSPQEMRQRRPPLPGQLRLFFTPAASRRRRVPARGTSGARLIPPGMGWASLFLLEGNVFIFRICRHACERIPFGPRFFLLEGNMFIFVSVVVLLQQLLLQDKNFCPLLDNVKNYFCGDPQSLCRPGSDSLAARSECRDAGHSAAV